MKFTVIITSYNQMQYIKEAIDSVLKQTYKNIELIIADDCSKIFDIKIIKKIIKDKNKKNFEYKILHGKKNVGTVKNINNALKEATGDYIMFFAADDKLDNNKVIANFVKEFEDSTKNVITTQCGLYDHLLKHKFSDYVNAKKALKLNKKSSIQIYEKMCEGCFYGSGGTAYRKEIFQKYGLFNEKYQYVEDWSYWLYILRQGEKIYYADFNCLCHRDGGISHSSYTKETIPPHVKQYYKDILNIYEEEVLPYIEYFNTKEKYRILRQYNETILYYSSFVPELVHYLDSFDRVRLSNRKLKYYWKLHTINGILNPKIISKLKFLIKYNKVVPITVCAWVIGCLLIINKLNIKNNNMLLILYLLSYIILYCLVHTVDKFIFYIKIYLNNKIKNA